MQKTALVVIDLQEGILPFAGGPHRADDVVARAARLAKSAASRVRRWSWSASAGRRISPKR
jgi:nicotinamidase-related amidase